MNPVWNEHFQFIVEDPLTQHLVVKIYDDEGLQASELIGLTHIRLNELEPGKVKDVWLPLVKDLEIQRDKKDRGKVNLELLYCPSGMGNGDGLHDMLILEVWDHDTFGKDYMGRCIITLTRVILEGEYKVTHDLDGAKSGKLNLNLKWTPQPIYRDT
nr:synaptotagmin-5-like [Ipomoea batatas]